MAKGVCVWPFLGLVMDLCPVFIKARDRRWGSGKESEDALDGHLPVQEEWRQRHEADTDRAITANRALVHTSGPNS